MRIAAILLLLGILAIPVAGLQIVEFCPDPYRKGEGDAFFVIEGRDSLDGVTIGDGEGVLRFPPGTRIDGRIIIAAEGPAYASTYGTFPDFEFRNASPMIPDMQEEGQFAMANRQDELILTQGDRVLQQVHWPGDVAAREGQIHYLEGGIWDPRPWFAGQSRFMPATFSNVTLTAFVSPDCSREVLEGALREAGQEILVSAYELEDAGIAQVFAEAHRRGVRVEVLLEGGPAGGISPAERGAATLMNRSGIPVYLMASTETAHARYRFTHAKMAVVDRSRVLIGSENLNPAGYPVPPGTGNRGWGVLIDNPDTARYFREVYFHDRSGGDILPFSPGIETVVPEPVPRGEPADGTRIPRTFPGVTVHPVLAPDTAFLVEDLIAGANRSVDIEVASIRNDTGDRLNPYLEAAVDASRRGATVRVLLDGSRYGVSGEEDNDEMATLITAIARREELPLEARIAVPEALGIRSIHNKGVIVDGSRVLVSSINWNENSPSFNREAGVILDHPGVAAYYTDVFVQDWDQAGGATPSGDLAAMRGVAVFLVICLLLGLYLIRRR